MNSVNSILNTARQSLLAQQQALQITSNNIANANTEGYSRQRVSFASSPYGDGVSIQSIDRLRNLFLDRQIQSEMSGLGSAQQQSQMLSRIESLLDETNTEGVSSQLSQMFAAFHDLASNPSGSAEREAVRTSADELASMLNDNDQRLAGVQKDADTQITQIVSTINSLAEQIAELNQRGLSSANVGDEIASNQLKDQRTALVEKLSSLIETQTYEDPSGGLTVMVGRGLVLVQGTTLSQLEAVPTGADSGVEIDYVNAAGIHQRITSQIQSGELGGILDVRDNVIADLRKRSDLFAASLIQQINQVHRDGVDLNGAAGGDFFAGLLVSAEAGDDNVGGGQITASSIVDLDALTLNEYEIRFNAGGTFDVVNVTTGTTVSAGNVYTAGTTVTFDGISVTLDDSGTAPAEGDVFSVNTFDGAASSIALSGAIAASTDAIAAGQGTAAGDNRNALALAALESDATAPDGRSTLSQYYTSILTDLGTRVSQAQSAEERQTYAVDQSRNLGLSISGVSIDEESADLIRFQRAFEASARVTNIADEMYQTILSLLS